MKAERELSLRVSHRHHLPSQLHWQLELEVGASSRRNRSDDGVRKPLAVPASTWRLVHSTWSCHLATVSEFAPVCLWQSGPLSRVEGLPHWTRRRMSAIVNSRCNDDHDHEDVSTHTTADPDNERRTELARVTSTYGNILYHTPLEPSSLTLNTSPDVVSSPLSLRLSAPRAVAAKDLVLEVLQPFSYPFRMTRVVARLPVEYEWLAPDDWTAAIMCILTNMTMNATLDVPNGNDTTALETVARDASHDPCCVRCVLISIPIPTGITLFPGFGVHLRVSLAGSSTTLRIPATGHLHTAACNHNKAPKGAVWRATSAGDIAALEAALAGGGSTEEVDQVRSRRWRKTGPQSDQSPPRLDVFRIALPLSVLLHR